MKATLIRIDAQDAGGTALPLRLASHDRRDLCQANGATWWPTIARLPALRYDFFGGGFDGQITAPSAEFTAAFPDLPQFSDRVFADARLRVWHGEPGSSGAGDAVAGLDLLFDGRLTGEPSLAAGLARFTGKPDDGWQDEPLLPTYAGTGGIEGGSDLEGQVKPLALGLCRFAPGVLIDAVDNVYQVSFGAIQAIDAVYDRLSPLTATSNYASLSALLGATIAEGCYATCLALGLVRLGAPADGRVSFDLRGDSGGTGGFVRKPGALIGRIAEIAGGTTDTANLAALDTACPWNLARVFTAQVTARQAIQQLADSVGACAGTSWLGTLFVQPLGVGTATGTLASDGTALPPVASFDAQPMAAPYWRIATDAELTWEVHSLAEIATGFALRGVYSAIRTYREDDLVFASDGRAFAYINATASAGNAPPAAPATSNSYWNVVGAATAGGKVGTNILTPGDTIYTQAQLETILGTAAAITGQGALATRGDIVYSGTFISGLPAALDPLNIYSGGYLKADLLKYNTTGNPTVGSLRPGEFGANVTESRTAAAIVGQAAIATSGNWVDISNASRPLGIQDSAFYASGRLAAIRTEYGNGLTGEALRPGEFGANVTESRTAAAIAGQGALATRGNIVYSGTFISGLPAALDPVNIYSGGYLKADLLKYNTTGNPTVGSLRPGEFGANVTESRTAAAIVGQAAIATSGNWADISNTSRPLGVQDSAFYASGRLAAIRTEYGNGLTGEALRPGEYGANVTESRTAAAIVGQAAAATDSTIEASADVTKSVSGPSQISLQYASDGTLSTALPLEALFKLTPAGGAAYTSGVTWAVSIVSGSFTGTVPSISGAGSGQLAINSGLAVDEALLNVTATRGGKTYPPFPVKVVRQTAAAASSGGSGGGSFGSDTSLSSFSTTAFAAISDELTITTASGSSSAALTASNLSLRPLGTDNGTSGVEMKWQRWNGSAWVDVGAVATASPSPSITTDPEGFVLRSSGSITCNRTATGLTASTSYKFRLVARISSGITRTISILGGEASAQG